MKKRTIAVILLSALPGLPVGAQILIGGSTALWTAINPANPARQSDYIADSQAQKGDTDIVGGVGGANPGFYVQFWNGGDDLSRTDGQLAWRLRMSGDSNPAGFSTYAMIGMDITGDGVLDLFVTAADVAGNADITIRDAGNDLNNSPSTTSISNTNTFAYATSATNFNWAPVTGVNDPAASSFNIDAANGNDYFVSFLVPFADLVSAAASLGIDPAFNDTKALAYVAVTSTNGNTVNADLNGLTKAEAGSTLLWTDLGAITPLLKADGTPIPEPSVSVFAAAIVALLLVRRRVR